MRGASSHRAQVEPVLQAAQTDRISIHDGDVVALGHQALSNARADLPGAQDYNFHTTASGAKGGILCLLELRFAPRADSVAALIPECKRLGGSAEPAGCTFYSSRLPVGMPSILSLR